MNSAAGAIENRRSRSDATLEFRWLRKRHTPCFARSGPMQLHLRLLTLLALASTAASLQGCGAALLAGGMAADTENNEAGQRRQVVYKAWITNDLALDQAAPEVTVAPACAAGQPGTCGLVGDDPGWQSCSVHMKQCADASCTSQYVRAFNVVLKHRYFTADEQAIDTACKADPNACNDPRSVELKFLESHNARMKDLIATKKAENKSKFDLGNPTMMNQFSDTLAKDIDAWKASMHARAVCP